MGKPYSVDLRMAVVRSIEAGCTREEAAELHGISLSSVGRFLRLWRSRGNVRAAKFGGYKGYALAPYAERLKRWIAEQPDITLEQLRRRLVQRKVTISIAAIFRFLRHLKLTFKKVLHAAEQDRPDVAAARRTWRRKQQRLDPQRLVFLDETAVATNIRAVQRCWVA